MTAWWLGSSFSPEPGSRNQSRAATMLCKSMGRGGLLHGHGAANPRAGRQRDMFHRMFTAMRPRFECKSSRYGRSWPPGRSALAGVGGPAPTATDPNTISQRTS